MCHFSYCYKEDIFFSKFGLHYSYVKRFYYAYLFKFCDKHWSLSLQVIEPAGWLGLAA